MPSYGQSYPSNMLTLDNILLFCLDRIKCCHHLHIFLVGSIWLHIFCQCKEFCNSAFHTLTLCRPPPASTFVRRYAFTSGGRLPIVDYQLLCKGMHLTTTSKCFRQSEQVLLNKDPTSLHWSKTGPFWAAAGSSWTSIGGQNRADWSQAKHCEEHCTA